MLHLLLHRLADPLHLAHDRRGRRQDDALHLAHDRRLDDPLHRHDDRRLRGGHLAAGHGVHRRHCLGTLSRQSGYSQSIFLLALHLHLGSKTKFSASDHFNFNIPPGIFSIEVFPDQFSKGQP